MYNLQGRLAESRKDFAAAISAQKKALRLWLLTYPSSYYKVAVGYTALGKAEAGSGDLAHALADLRQALSLEDGGSSKENSRAYLETSLVYANALKRSGERERGALLEADARAKLLRSHSPNATISAESLRSQ